MRAYMGYSIAAGAIEGAVLIVASNAKQAKKMAYRECILWNVDDWLDQGIKWLRDDYVFLLADKEKIKLNIPHVIDDPIHCTNCEQWGCGMYLLENKIKCENCDEYPGDILAKMFIEHTELYRVI